MTEYLTELIVGGGVLSTALWLVWRKIVAPKIDDPATPEDESKKFDAAVEALIAKLVSLAKTGGQPPQPASIAKSVSRKFGLPLPEALARVNKALGIK